MQCMFNTNHFYRKNIFCLLLSCLSISISLSQNQYGKHKVCIDYIDSILKNENSNVHLNISPIIKYIDISPFERDIIEFKGADSIIHFVNPYFKPFFDSNLVRIINNDVKGDKFLIFSKPINQTLTVLLFEGDYDSIAIKNVPYFGVVREYLFFFNANHKIQKVFSVLIDVN